MKPDMLATVLRYMEQDLDAGQTRELAGQLDASAESRRQVAGLLLHMAILREQRPEPRQARPRVVRLVPPIPPARSRGLVVGVTIAAVATATAVTAALLLLPRIDPAPPRNGAGAPPSAATSPRATAHRRQAWPQPPAPQRPPRSIGQVASASGLVRAIEEGARPTLGRGSSVRSGRGLETVGPRSRAVLDLVGGARLELSGDAQLPAINADDAEPAEEDVLRRVLLERGTLRVDLSAVTSPWTIVSPLVEVSAQRSQFKLTAATGELRVAVQSGQVTMTRLPDGHRLTVEAGAAALMTETQALAIAPPPRPVALLLVGRSPGRREVDQALEQRLENLGYAVTQLLDARLDRAAVLDRDLVVLSPSVSAAVLRPRLSGSGLREAPIPVINCEIEAMPALGMTTAAGMLRERARVTLQNPAHPLAAGLAGNVRVAQSPTSIMWGRPTAEATVVASLENGGAPVLFGYDTGAEMVGLAAPARRASCFLSEKAVLQASDAAWQLFDGTVQWVTGRK